MTFVPIGPPGHMVHFGWGRRQCVGGTFGLLVMWQWRGGGPVQLCVACLIAARLALLILS